MVQTYRQKEPNQDSNMSTCSFSHVIFGRDAKKGERRTSSADGAG